MKLAFSLAVAAAMLCSACSGGVGGGGGGLTKEECKYVFVKGFQLQGMPEVVYRDTIDISAQGCAESDAVSRKDYECVVAAETLEDYEDCQVVFRFR
ncbi:MAG TPA: hypothetical protein PKZ76_12135, partial [Xanthomonadaceae bacterium]|nr:hypothetical protein [Xanthomonadaceae bacterium]